MADTGDVDRLVELAKDIKIAMFTTVDADGNFISRPMAHQVVEPNAEFWFYADRTSSVVAHVAANPHVGVTLSSASTWISINGSAEVVDDSETAAAMWNAGVEAWLPQGPRDPSVVLLKVTGHGAEYWDTPGGRVTTLLSFAKAKATGEPYQGTENATVDP